MTIISVEKSDARVLTSEKFYLFAKNIYRMHVVFSSEWEGLTILAHFRLEDDCYDIDMTTLDEVSIPWEFFACKNNVGKTLQVSFDGRLNDHIVIPTPRVSLGVIRESDGEKCGEYKPPAPPTPDLYQQLKHEISNKVDNSDFLAALEELKKCVNHALAPLPAGTVSLWTKDEVPEGWAICDGQNGTPDLISPYQVARYIVKL